MIFNKFSDRNIHGKIAVVYNDAWSDLVNSGFESIGISSSTRDAAQAVIDYGKNQVLPKGGEIPPAQDSYNVFSRPISTGYNIGFNVTPLMLIGVGAILIAGFYLIKKA